MQDSYGGSVPPPVPSPAIMSLLLPALLLVVLVPLVLALVRANELFCLRVRAGRIRVVRGRLPQALLDEIDDVLRGAPGADVTLRAVVEDRTPRFYLEGELSEAIRQRLRNVLAQFPLARIRNAPKRRR